MEKGSVPAIGVLISGRGSNLAALIDATRDGRLSARIALVISNVPDAGGLETARAAGIETVAIPHRRFHAREAYDEALVLALRDRAVELVCLAGFMRVLGRGFCDAFPSAVLNIHPSLLPSFPGPDASGQAVRHGVKVSGATVHFVTSDLDAGPIVLQRAVPVLDDDTPGSLANRILAAEHAIYPEAVQRVLWDRWHLEGRRVVFDRASESLR